MTAHHILSPPFHFQSLTYTIRATLAFSQNRSVTGHWWARLRVAADGTIHANTASTNIWFPGLSSQENITFIIFAVARHALVA